MALDSQHNVRSSDSAAAASV